MTPAPPPIDVEWLALRALAGRPDERLGAAPAGAVGRLPKSVIEDLIERGAVEPAQVHDPQLQDAARARAGADGIGAGLHDGDPDVARLRSAHVRLREWDWAGAAEDAAPSPRGPATPRAA